MTTQFCLNIFYTRRFFLKYFISFELLMDLVNQIKVDEISKVLDGFPDFK